MRKLYTFLILLISIATNAQYFGNEICFLEKHISAQSNTLSGNVVRLKYLNSTGIDKKYSFKSDTIIERNDSIFIQKNTIPQGISTTFLYSPYIKDLDSFIIQYTYLNNEVETITFYIDSVTSNGISEITHFHNKPTQNGYIEYFSWRDSLGDLNYGPNFLDVFNWIDYSIEYLAYSKNNEIYFMDGQPWETEGDTSCEFNQSLKTLSIKEPTLQSLVLYPNPSCGYINLNLNASTGYSIYNSKGILVMQGSYNSQIDISGLKTGIYYIEILGIEGNVRRGRFIKE